jgi:hypothetical protein
MGTGLNLNSPFVNQLVQKLIVFTSVFANNLNNKS